MDTIKAIKKLFLDDPENIYDWFEEFQKDILEAFEHADTTKYPDTMIGAYCYYKARWKYQNNI